MKCKKCRKTIPDGSKFCNHCGTPTEKKKLYRRPDGLYEKVLTIDGKRVAFRAKKEKDVFLKIAAYEEKREKGLTFSEVAEMWFDDHWETLSPTTQKGYRRAFEEIKEYFADQYIAEITHKNINAYVKQLPRSYARKTCTNRLTILSMIFKFAIVEDMIADNPCSYITVPKGHGSSKRRAPTSDEIAQIRKSIDVSYKGFPVGLYAVFLLYTGCRKGEALALTFADIDKKARRIHVTKSVYFVHNQGTIKKPKTEAGNREIILPEFLIDLLPDGRARDYVFSPTPDAPMTEGFHQYAMVSWRDQTGLDLTAHQLRHGYATLLHEADIDVKDAQDLLGHADASTTQNIYTEVSDRRRKAVAEKINSYLN